MTIARGLELTQRAREIGDGLLLESLAATASGDINRAKFLVQESIVLKNITKVIAAVTIAKMQNNEEI